MLSQYCREGPGNVGRRCHINKNRAHCKTAEDLLVVFSDQTTKRIGWIDKLTYPHRTGQQFTQELQPFLRML